MKNISMFIAVVFLSSCYGMADYNGPPPRAQSDGLKPVDPETLRVDSKKYPVFHLTEVRTPPLPRSEYKPEVVIAARNVMVDILPSDKWNVTYKWKDYYLITSETYIERQCEFDDNCMRAFFSQKPQPYYLHAIYINKSGKVSGGWKLLKNPKKVALSSDRKTYFNPSEDRNLGWETVEFEKAQ